jgi:hypothetical protein
MESCRLPVIFCRATTNFLLDENFQFIFTTHRRTSSHPMGDFETPLKTHSHTNSSLPSMAAAKVFYSQQNLNFFNKFNLKKIVSL